MMDSECTIDLYENGQQILPRKEGLAIAKVALNVGYTLGYNRM